MSGYWIGLIIVGCILIILSILLSIRTRTKRKKTSPYEEALISLIDGDEDYALKKLQAAVFDDSDNVEAYIRLAELLRKRNEPLKALQIHKYLFARRGLPKKIINRILFQITKDYITIEAYQKAIDTVKKLIKSEPQNEQYYKLLLLTYEKSSLWNEAIETFRKMAKLFSYPKRKLYNYEIYAAHNADKKGNTDWASKVLTHILKTDPNNIPGLIFLGDIEYSKGNIEEAIKLYQKIIDVDARSAHIVFPRLMKTYFEKGQFPKIEEAYKSILEKIPDDNITTNSLADYYLKMGRLNEAYELLKNEVETHPDSTETNLLLLLTEMELEKSKALPILHHIIDIFRKKETFKCKRCGATSKEFIIRCPECGGWETYELVKEK